ncbi:MAG: hypothetical protein JHC87_04195 [Thermoleophilaceae bacterium]|nr:hypothetical protein [Thermoleophilaceae bacterium]
MGPVEYAVFRFPGNEFKGEIVPALADLVESETVAILDLIFILKDAEGAVAWFELQDAPEHLQGLVAVTGGRSALLSEADVDLIASELEPDSSAALLVWENVWAERFANAIRGANGEVLLTERVPAEIVDAALAAVAIA